MEITINFVILGMCCAIDFDSDFVFEIGEIDDEIIDGMLSTKAVTVLPCGLQTCPDQHFCFGQLRPKCFDVWP